MWCLTRQDRTFLNVGDFHLGREKKKGEEYIAYNMMSWKVCRFGGKDATTR